MARLTGLLLAGLAVGAILAQTAGIALGDIERSSARDHSPVDATFTPDPATREEYERLYVQHADINPTFHDYRKKTSRKITVPGA